MQTQDPAPVKETTGLLDEPMIWNSLPDQVDLPCQSQVVTFKFKLPNVPMFEQKPHLLGKMLAPSLNKDNPNAITDVDIEGLKDAMTEQVVSVIYTYEQPAHMMDFLDTDHDMYVFMSANPDLNLTKLQQMLKVKQSAHGTAKPKYAWQFKFHTVRNCCSGRIVENGGVDYNQGTFDFDKAIANLQEETLSYLFNMRIKELAFLKEEYDRYLTKDLFKVKPALAGVKMANAESQGQ